MNLPTTSIAFCAKKRSWPIGFIIATLLFALSVAHQAKAAPQANEEVQMKASEAGPESKASDAPKAPLVDSEKSGAGSEPYENKNENNVEFMKGNTL